MKNITLSVDEQIIEEARTRAKEERATLNAEFRKWLAEYARHRQRADLAMDVIARMQTYVRTGGRRFSRDVITGR